MVVVTVTDLAVECVRVLQWGEAVGLRRGVGPAATGIAATSGRGGPPAVLAAVGKLALKAKNRMTLDCVVCRPPTRRGMSEFSRIFGTISSWRL